MLVWGFTAVVVDRLLALGGWERPWDDGRSEELPPERSPLPGRATAGSRWAASAPERRATTGWRYTVGGCLATCST